MDLLAGGIRFEALHAIGGVGRCVSKQLTDAKGSSSRGSGDGRRQDRVVQRAPRGECTMDARQRFEAVDVGAGNEPFARQGGDVLDRFVHRRWFVSVSAFLGDLDRCTRWRRHDRIRTRRQQPGGVSRPRQPVTLRTKSHSPWRRPGLVAPDQLGSTRPGLRSTCRRVLCPRLQCRYRMWCRPVRSSRRLSRRIPCCRRRC